MVDVDKPNEISTYADQPGYDPLADGYARLKGADRVVFHNGFGFDLHAINMVAPGTLTWDQIYDTLVVSRLVNPEISGGHSLDAWGRRLGHNKVEHSEWDRFSEAMVVRNRVDVVILQKLYDKLYPAAGAGWGQSIALEHQVAHVISLQEQNGFLLDVNMAELLAAELRQEQTDIEQKLQAQYPPMWVSTKDFTPKQDNAQQGYVKGCSLTKVTLEVFNPGSRQQIEARLRKQYGWKPTKFTATGVAKLDETTLNEIAVEFPEARPMARYFRLTKQLGQIADGKQSWLKMVRSSNRVHGAVNPNGAITGRMSHFAPNMANIDKKDLRMREVWLPRPGWKLVGIDASSLELRMLAHYLHRWDDGAYAKLVVDGDAHTRTMLALVEVFPEITRNGTKTITYAALYGAGNRKLGLIVIQDYLENGHPRPKGSPTSMGKAVRAAMESGIIGFRDLVATAKSRHVSQKWVRGLDGRRIFTRSEHAALNTLLQGAGAIVMKQALTIFHFELFARTPDLFKYCVNVHDEVQIEAHPDIADHVGQAFVTSIQKAGERLALRCPLTGAYVVGNNWKETH